MIRRNFALFECTSAEYIALFIENLLEREKLIAYAGPADPFLYIRQITV